MLISSMVAGSFYPADPQVLRESIRELLNKVEDNSSLPIPKAIIAPHAGYVYSGPIAASAYSCLTKAKEKIKRVVLIAPAHKHFVNGIITTKAQGYETPLGQVKIDRNILDGLTFSYLSINEEAFLGEHAIETHLPFLQVILSKFVLVPLLIGDVEDEQIEKILNELWNGPETLIVISSDLSHYHSYEEAKILDKKTADAIIKLNSKEIYNDSACCASGIRGLISIAAKKKMHVTKVDLRNSGDISSVKDKVVGYGAFHFN